jgi:DNA-binding transcriptional LysR family regulator
MSFELRHLRYVVAVADHVSLGRAAEALGMTQPALTRSVQLLEHQVGVPLFTRSRSGVVPTDEGRLFVERAREVVRIADELAQDSRRSQLTSGFPVGVGAGPYPTETIVPDALGAFAATHPLSRVRVVTRDWEDLLRRLRAREIDFAVMETSTLLDEHDLDVESLPTHSVFFVARRGHPLADQEWTGPSRCFAYPFIAFSRYPPRAMEPMLASRPAGLEPERPFPAVEIGNLAAVKRLIAKSDGIAALSIPLVADELRDGSFVLLGTEPWMNLAYGIVTLKDRPLSPSAGALRDLIRSAEAALLLEESALAARHLVNGVPRRDRLATVPA